MKIALQRNTDSRFPHAFHALVELSLSVHPSFVSTPSVWWFRESQAHLLGRMLSEFHFLLLRSKNLTRVTSRKKGFIPLTSPGSSASKRGRQCSRDWVAPTGESRDSSIRTFQGSAYHLSSLLQPRTPTQAMAPPAFGWAFLTSTSIIKSTTPQQTRHRSTSSKQPLIAATLPGDSRWCHVDNEVYLSQKPYEVCNLLDCLWVQTSVDWIFSKNDTWSRGPWRWRSLPSREKGPPMDSSEDQHELVIKQPGETWNSQFEITKFSNCCQLRYFFFSIFSYLTETA